ncbi:uncharacterized protein LOC141911240 [Tubulanus polymorphus]|uniref:uncharacterized protein LOC141911240 n=1 Tax=Tubulanus polymorphus TaxID=672921 RepID=UPI003DA237B5
MADTGESKNPERIDSFAWSRIMDSLRKCDTSLEFLSDTLEIWNKFKTALSLNPNHDSETLISSLCTTSEEANLNRFKNAAESGCFKPSVIFVGALNSGKSTLINTILGTKNLLPSKELPCTARITRLNYTNLKPFYQLVSSNIDGTEEIVPDTRTELDKLKIDHAYVRPDLGSPTQKNVNRILDVFINNEVLKTGIQIIDTPGLSESDGLDNLVKSLVSKASGHVARPLIVYVIDGVRRMSLQDREMIKWLLDESEIKVKFVFSKCDISRKNVEMDTPDGYNVDEERGKKFDCLKNDIELLYKQMKDDLMYIPNEAGEGVGDVKLDESRWCSCVSALNYKRAKRKKGPGAAMDEWFIRQYDRMVRNIVTILVENISEQILCIYEDAMSPLHRCLNFVRNENSILAENERANVESENVEQNVRHRISKKFAIFDENCSTLLILQSAFTTLVRVWSAKYITSSSNTLKLILSKLNPQIVELTRTWFPHNENCNKDKLILMYLSILDTLLGYIKREMQRMLQYNLVCLVVEICEEGGQTTADEFAASYGLLLATSPLQKFQQKCVDTVWKTTEKYFQKLVRSELMKNMLERVHSIAKNLEQMKVAMLEELIHIFPKQILPELGKQLCDACALVLSETHDEFNACLQRQRYLRSASVCGLSTIFLGQVNEDHLVEMEVFAQASINSVIFGDVTLGPVIHDEPRTYNIERANSKNPKSIMAFVLQKDDVTRAAPRINFSLDSAEKSSLPLTQNKMENFMARTSPRKRKLSNWRQRVKNLQKTCKICPIEHGNVLKVYNFVMPSYSELWIVVERCQCNLATYLSTHHPSLLTRYTVALGIAEGFGALEKAGSQFQGCSAADIWIKEMSSSGEIEHEEHIKICRLGEKEKPIGRTMSECDISFKKSGQGLQRSSSTRRRRMKLDYTSQLLGDCFCDLLDIIFPSADSRLPAPSIPAHIVAIVGSFRQYKITLEEASMKIREIKDK